MSDSDPDPVPPRDPPAAASTHRGRGPPTHAPERGDRGQTVQDFAVGASVFLLTIAFAFAFIPTLFTPFQESVGPGLDSQADRAASAIVENGSTAGRPNWMNNSTARTAIRPGDDSDALQDAYGLPSTSRINVTVTPLPPDDDAILSLPTGDDLASGDSYRGRPATTVSRVVVVRGVSECDPTIDPDAGTACRLTVRVW